MIRRTKYVYQMVQKESSDKRIEENIRRTSRKFEEKGYSSELQLRGRKSAFEEYFDGILLDDQNIPQVGPFQNIKETESFQNGRKRGILLINNGLTLEQYHNFLLEFEARFPEETPKKSR